MSKPDGDELSIIKRRLEICEGHLLYVMDAFIAACKDGDVPQEYVDTVLSYARSYLEDNNINHTDSEWNGFINE